MNIERLIGWLLVLFCTPLVLFLCWLLFVLLPVALWTEQQCLAKGMPNASVTIMLDRYCLNLDGSVTVRVEKL